MYRMVATRSRRILGVIWVGDFPCGAYPDVRVFLQMGLRIARNMSSGTLRDGALFPFDVLAKYFFVPRLMSLACS